MKIVSSFFVNGSSKNQEKLSHINFVPWLVILQISFMPAEPMAGISLKFASFSKCLFDIIKTLRKQIPLSRLYKTF